MLSSSVHRCAASVSQTRVVGSSQVFRAARVAPRVASRSRTVRVRASEGEIQYCSPQAVKSLINDKGYIFWDIRTPEEHAEGAKRYMKNIPVAFMTEKGPKLNGKFGAYFAQEFPNKMSRVILVKVVEGGILALLEVDPLDAKDLKPKWRLTGQTSGVRYQYGDGETDDSA